MCSLPLNVIHKFQLGGRAGHKRRSTPRILEIAQTDIVIMEMLHVLMQGVLILSRPFKAVLKRRDSCYQLQEEIMGQYTFLTVQSEVESNHPPIGVFIFFFLWMTWHLWCHANTGWASLLHRNWFNWLSDLDYQTQPFVTSTGSFLLIFHSDVREQLQVI